jgi:hypothetical protein
LILLCENYAETEKLRSSKEIGYMTNQDILKRLAYIKFLFKVGVDQSKQPGVIAYTAILSIHDAIDWFMNLACIENKITETNKLSAITAKDPKRKGKTNVYLTDYFTILPALKYEVEVNSINTLRNNLKHKFILPSQLAITESINSAKEFFEENTKIIFSLDFNGVSVIDLIGFEPIKILLKQAIVFQIKNEVENCISEISKAYYELWQIDMDFIRDKKQFSYIDIYGNPYLQIPQLEGKPELQILKGYIDSLITTYNKNFQELNDSMKIFALGIDYRKYLKLKSFLPSTSIKDKNGNYQVTKPRNVESITNEDLTFAIDFVINCALEIQRFKLSK